jgi:hypothetical protein
MHALGNVEREVSMKNATIIALGLITGIIIGMAGLIVPATAQEPVTSYETTGDFNEVAADLQDAIINHGYVIDYHGRIGDMLKRTASDVGAAGPLYKEAEFVQFCSAVLSRAAMEADITNIAFCPYVLFVYEPEAEAGTVTVGFRRLPEGDGRNEINTLLDEIAREAAGQ